MSNNVLLIVAIVLFAWDTFDIFSGHALSKWLADCIKEAWKKRQAKLRCKRWAKCQKQAREIAIVPWEEIE